MQQEITILGKNTTIEFFVNVHDSEPVGRNICDWRVNDFAKTIERETQLHFAVERYTRPDAETHFEVNRVKYHRISGNIQITGNGTVFLFVKSLRVDGSNYTNDLTQKAYDILSAELRPILIEAYKHLDACKLEAWNEMIERIKNDAAAARRRADELFAIAAVYQLPESARETKWRTLDGRIWNAQGFARVRAKEAGQTVYFEDTYRIWGNVLLETVEHSTEI